MSKNQCFLFVHNFAYFFSFLLETCIFKKQIYLNKFKLHHLYMHLCLCVWINLYNDIFRFQCRRSLIFQTMNSVRSNNISLKYQRFTTLGFQDIGIRKSEFVSKNQLLWKSINWYKVAISRKQKSIVSLIRKSLIFNKNCKVRQMLVFNFWFFLQIGYFLFLYLLQRNWFFVTNSDFLIPISLQSNIV